MSLHSKICFFQLGVAGEAEPCPVVNGAGGIGWEPQRTGPATVIPILP